MKVNINIFFGKRVTELRVEKKLSQEDLAFRCGLHRTYIGAIERGEKSPTLNTIEKIANGLEIQLCDLFKKNN
ncbi:MAG: helix-turn-helix transcriptional regulator [Clostridia bacterium]|nr:helix-turn-helix transcriptional regulator [Clostridia bacterium]